jgi:hypothetical protein
MWEIYFYVDQNGDCPFLDWYGRLQRRVQAKLDAKIDMLAQHGEILNPSVLSPTPVRGIMELCVTGRVTLRPMVCRGPVRPREEYTLLCGAVERDSKYVPRNAAEIAERYRDEIKADPGRRRKPRV